MKYVTPEDQNRIRPSVHPSARQHHVTPVSSPLYVVTVITNPHRYYIRYKLYQAFEKRVEDAGGILYTVELALRDRHFEVTQHDNPRHIQLRSPSILWHKENLINIGIRHLPPNWEYVAWIDSDVQFARPDWAVETVHQLQIYKVVQMWSHATDLGPDFQPLHTCSSLFYSHLKNHHILEPLRNAQNSNPRENGRDHGSGYPFTGVLHTGYAWAARRSAISDLGGLGDIAILGSGDRHMAYALLGTVQRSIPKAMHPNYKDCWIEWQRRAERYIQRSVGIVPGLILHYWHGSKQQRRYQDRWKILVEHRFDPKLDLKYDPQGVLQLTERNWGLRDDIRNYFALRDEDSTWLPISP